MKLDIYFFRRFIRSTFLVFAILFGLGLMIEVIEQIRIFSRIDLPLGTIVALATLRLPSSLYELLPIIVVIATLTMFLNLARTSELVVTRASGRGAMRAIVPPLLASLLLGILSVAVLNPVASRTTREYDAWRNRILEGEAQVFSVSGEGLWLREGTPDGQVVIRAARSNFDASELYGVTLMGFDAEGHPAFRMEAASALIEDGDWVLTDVKHWTLSEDVPNPEASAQTRDHFTVPTTLSPEEIRDTFGSTTTVPFWDLPQHIKRLETAGFSARAYKMELQAELSLPLTFVAMVLIGAGFTMRHTRLGNTSQRVVTAILLAFGFFFLRNIAILLGQSGQAPVVLAAWAPPLAVIFAALALLLHLEDG